MNYCVDYCFPAKVNDIQNSDKCSLWFSVFDGAGV